MKLLGIADTASIENNETHAGAVTRLAQQLNMAFVVYRGLMSNELQKGTPTVSGEDTAKVLLESSKRIRDYWIANFSPNIKAGLQISGLDDATASLIAGKYAGKMADQINEVSDRAFLEGYHAALNKNWDKAVAWRRISEAYGIDPSQMRKWVSYYPEDGYHPQDIPEKSRGLLNRFLGERGRRIGDHESWSIKQLGKQTHWQQRVASGDIPETALKVWYTARDELVCPVCAPLDGIAIPISSEFDTGAGGFFMPPLHVNCRCEVNLQFPDVVTKAMGDDPFNRNKKGQFASKESRNLLQRQRDIATKAGSTIEEVSEHPGDFTVKPKTSSDFKRLQNAFTYGDIQDTALASDEDMDQFKALAEKVGAEESDDKWRLYGLVQCTTCGGIHTNADDVDLNDPNSPLGIKSRGQVGDLSILGDSKYFIPEGKSEISAVLPSEALIMTQMTRPSTITRGMKSQPQKTASSNTRMQVRQQPKEELPYGLERVISTPDFIKAVSEQTALTPQESKKAVEAARKKQRPKSTPKSLNLNKPINAPEPVASEKMVWTPLSILNLNGLGSSDDAKTGGITDGSVIDFTVLGGHNSAISSAAPNEALDIEYDNFNQATKDDPNYSSMQDAPGILIHPEGSAVIEDDDGIQPTGEVTATLLVRLRKGEVVADMAGSDYSPDNIDGTLRSVISDGSNISDSKMSELMDILINSDAGFQSIDAEGRWTGPELDIYYGEPSTGE